MSEINYRRGSVKKYVTRKHKPGQRKYAPCCYPTHKAKAKKAVKRMIRKIDRRANDDAVRGLYRSGKRSGLHCRSGVVCHIKTSRIALVDWLTEEEN